MGVFDKMMDIMRLNDDEEDYYDEEEFDEVEEEAQQKKRFFFKKTGTDDIEEELTVNEPTTKSFSRASSSSKITPMRAKRSTAMEVCIIKPQSFEDAREISETLLANRTVILNMEGLDLALAQRIIDFISGSTYAINGNLQKISNYIFIVTPHSVDISGDLQELVGTFDFGGLQTGF